jgi:MFS transporter, MHS family, shikimate and dehydroshikimate transport protein
MFSTLDESSQTDGSELFATRYRYSALSTLCQVSGVFALGLTPLIAAWLVSRGDGSLWLVSTYAVAVAAISLTCAHLLPETRGRNLHEPWVETKEPAEELVTA